MNDPKAIRDYFRALDAEILAENERQVEYWKKKTRNAWNFLYIYSICLLVILCILAWRDIR